MNSKYIAYSKIYKIILLFISFFITFIVYDPLAADGYEFQFMIPLSFGIVYYIYSPLLYKYGIGYFVLNIVLIFRYLFTPVFIKFAKYNMINSQYIDSYFLRFSIWFIILEMVTICLTLFIFDKLNHTNLKSQKKIELKRIFNNKVLFFFFILILINIVLFPQSFSQYNFIFNLNTDQNMIIKLPTLVKLTLDISKIIITLCLIEKNFNQYKITKKNKYIIYSILIIIIINISIFDRVVRNTILTQGLTFLYLLIRLFPTYRKRISIIVISCLIGILLTVTVVRFQGTEDIKEGLDSYNIHEIANMFSSYFAGQPNIAVGLNTKELFKEDTTILNFISDVFSNVAIINKFIPGKLDTVTRFNYTIYNHWKWADQIPPTSIQGYIHFGVLGVIILPIIISFLILKLDQKSKSAITVPDIFIYAYLATFIAFYSVGNITILSAFTCNVFVPLYIIIKFISKLKITRN